MSTTSGEPGGGATEGAAAAAFATAESDPIEDALRAAASEQPGSSVDKPGFGKRISSLLSRLRPDLSGVKEKAGQWVAAAKEKMPEMYMPNAASIREGLSKAGEVIDKTPVAGFLKRSIESYLKKFDPRGKDKKAWGFGIAAGAGSVVAAAEFGATLGFSPALRGLAVFATLNASDFLYGRLHNAYLVRATGSSMIGAVGSFVGIGGDSKTADFRNQVIGLEKTIAAKGLRGQDFVDAYKAELSSLRRASVDANDPAIINNSGLSEGQVNKLLKLGTQYAVVNATARSLAAGMSAGSFMGAMGELGVRTFLNGSVTGALAEDYVASQPHLPEMTMPQMPHVELPNSFDHVGAIPHPVDTLPSDSLPDLSDKITGIEATPEFQTGIAAEVGKYLPARDDILNEALKAMGILPAEIDPSSFDAGREAALHVMEGKGNEIFHKALTEALSADPSADVSKATEIAQGAYADWLSSADAHTQIAEAAKEAVAKQLVEETSITEKVANNLLTHQDWFKEVPIDTGATAGKILDLTWTNADAPVMGANIAANWDLLHEMWGQMAQSNPQLLAETHFPVSFTEINDLVARAQAGDELAIKKLRLALHWIPAGSKFRAVAANVSREVLKLAA